MITLWILGAIVLMVLAAFVAVMAVAARVESFGEPGGVE
jgi:hypothetical protein